MKVVYWSDFVCPFCYIGVTRLKKAAIELNATLDLELKAFQLDPNADNHTTEDTLTRFADKYNLSKEVASEQIESISELGRREGLDFKYATTLFTNTMDAHRLNKLAKLHNVADIFTEKLYKAYFTDNLELADHTLLKNLALECGLDSNDIDRVLNSDEFKNEVLTDEFEAYRKGIDAVPYFVIGDGYAITGAESVGNIARVMRLAQQQSV